MSRALGNRIGCTLVLALLACAARLPAADAPLGVVLQANLAHVKDSAISEGATVYPGDELHTDVGGSLDLRIVNSRFGLAANSRARFYSGVSGSIAELTDGTLTFRRNAGADGIEIVASDVRIVPKGDGAVTGQVTVLSPCKITVTSVAGEIEVRAGEESRVVKEGEVYAVSPKVGVFAVKNLLSPGNPAYHESHAHQTCAWGGTPKDPGQFRKLGLVAGLAGAGAGAIIGFKLLSSQPAPLESPTNP